jgi:hypothetical protein
MLNISRLRDFTQFEFQLHNTERVLTNLSATVILAPFAGLAKFYIGAVTVGACAILCVGTRVHGNENLGKWAFSVLKHGGGNMLAGMVEAIPFVGLALFIHRHCHAIQFSRGGIFIETHDDDKYMPYESVARQFFEISNGMDGSSEQYRRVIERFDLAYPNAGARDAATLEEMKSDFDRILTQVYAELGRLHA